MECCLSLGWKEALRVGGLGEDVLVCTGEGCTKWNSILSAVDPHDSNPIRALMEDHRLMMPSALEQRK